MKIIKKVFLTVLILTVFSLQIATAQSPAPPNNNGSNPTGGGNTPVGGGAPVGGGLLILIGMAGVYGGYKIYQRKRKSLLD